MSPALARGGFKPPVELSTPVGLRITLPDQCLLYLLDRVDIRPDDPAAQEATQERIAQALNARRSHVSRAMGRTRARGFAKTAKVHVAGESRRRLAYFLTEPGLRRAQDLRRKVEEERITVIDLEGRESERRLYEVPLLLPRRPKLSDLVSSVKGGRLDLRKFLDRQARHRAGKVYDVRDAAPPVHFRGRAGEIDRLESFLQDPRARGILIVGLPGIGKSAVASQWVAGVKGRLHVLWRRVSSESTVPDILRDLAGLLAGAGRPALADYLQRPPEGGPDLALSLLRRDLPQAPAILVFDDAHLATRDVGALLGDLVHLEAPPGTVKIALLSRERVGYVSADDVVRNRVWELELEDLPRPDALAVLEALGAPAGRREEIVDRCGGHPLSLELAGAGRLPLAGVRRTSAAWFAEEALGRLDRAGRRALDLACVFAGSVLLPALGPESGELIRRCLLREVEGDRAVVHDLVREAVLQTLSVRSLAALHLRAGTFLASSRDPVDVVAAIRHFLRGGGFDRAGVLASERGGDVIENGLSGAFLPLLDPRTWGTGKGAAPPRARLLRGEALFALGRRSEAARAFEEAREARDPLTAAEARLGQGKSEVQRRPDVALQLLLDAREGLERLGSLRLLAEAQYWIGGVHEEAGRTQDAQEAFERGRAVAADVGDRRWEGLCTYGLGRLRSLHRDYAGAVDQEAEALRLLERGGHRLEVAKVCAGLGGNLLELEKFDEAQAYLTRATAEARTTGAVSVLAASLYNLAAIRMEKRDITGMIPLFEEALGGFEITEEHDRASWCEAWIAYGLWSQGRGDAANQRLRRAEDLIRRTTEPALRIRARLLLGRACRRMDRKEDARGHLDRALSEARREKLPQLEERIARDLGQLA